MSNGESLPNPETENQAELIPSPQELTSISNIQAEQLALIDVKDAKGDTENQHPGHNTSVESSQSSLIEIEELRRQEQIGKLRSFALEFANLDEESLKRPQRSPSTGTPPKEHPRASKWGAAALNGKSFSDEEGLRPANKRELFQAEKLYDINAHIGSLNAKLRVERDGIYKIGEDGKSKLRSDGSLSHLPRSTRRSIKRTEKIYQKTEKHLEHARHTLEYSGEQKRFGRLRKVFKRKH